MKLSYYAGSAVAAVVAAAVFLFINWQISTGILAGMLFFLLYYHLLKSDFESLLKEEKPRILTKIFRMFVLVVPMLASFLYPQYLSIIGVAVGILLSKLCLIGYNILVKNI